MLPRITELAIYPLKSGSQITLPSAWCDYRGLEFDRRFILCEMDGRFITARREPVLLEVMGTITADGIVFSAPAKTPLKLIFKEFSKQRQAVEIWNDAIAGHATTQIADSWFSELLGRPVQLIFNDPDSQRLETSQRAPERPIVFADGYPLLLTNTASLKALQQSIGEESIAMRRFRPNLVVDTETPWIEDSWKRLRVGEAELEVTRFCVRCVLTTRDPLTGTRSPSGEPLRTLAKIHRLDNKACFGVNLKVIKPGLIRHGDPFEVLEADA